MRSLYIHPACCCHLLEDSLPSTATYAAEMVHSLAVNLIGILLSSKRPPTSPFPSSHRMPCSRVPLLSSLAGNDPFFRPSSKLTIGAVPRRPHTIALKTIGPSPSKSLPLRRLTTLADLRRCHRQLQRPAPLFGQEPLPSSRRRLINIILPFNVVYSKRVGAPRGCVQMGHARLNGFQLCRFFWASTTVLQSQDSPAWLPVNSYPP